MFAGLDTFLSSAGNIKTDLELQHTAAIQRIFDLLSPAYANNVSVPVFAQQLPQQQQNTHGSHRVVSLRRSIDDFKIPLDRVTTHLAALGQTSASLSSLPLDEKTEWPFPDMKSLREQLDASDEIVKDRTLAVISVFDAMQKQSLASWKSVHVKIKATESALKTFLDTSKRMTMGWLLELTVALLDVNSRRMVSNMSIVMKYVATERKEAAKQQRLIFGEILELCRDHSMTVGHVASLLGQECKRLKQADRDRLERQITELSRHSASYFAEAQLYYDQKGDTFAFQPVSPVIYVGLKNVEKLMHYIFVDFVLCYCRDLADPKSIGPGGIRAAARDSIDASSIALSEFVDRYAKGNPTLFREAKSTIESLSESDPLNYPQRGELNQLLWQWMEHYQDANSSAREKLKVTISSIESKRNQLTEEVARSREIQKRWYDPTPPTISSFPSDVGLLRMAARSPDVIKLMNNMNSHVESVNSEVSSYHKKLQELQESQLRMVEDATNVGQCVRHLSQWSKASERWEELIVKERAFSFAWKTVSERHNSEIAHRFIIWNYHTTEQLLAQKEATEILIGNMASKSRDLRFDLIALVKKEWAERQKALSYEIQLLTSLQRDLRGHGAGKIADQVVRCQTQAEEWMLKHQERHTCQLQSLVKQDIAHHRDNLMNLLNMVRSNFINGQDNPIIKYLEQLDDMYHSSIRFRDQEAENTMQLLKDKHTVNQLVRIEQPLTKIIPLPSPDHSDKGVQKQ